MKRPVVDDSASASVVGSDAPSDRSEFYSRTLSALGILAVWLVLVPRMVSRATGDTGVFVSVAERLRAGDRLYVDVIAGKDPLFYYELAIVRSVSEHLAAFLDMAWALGLVCCVNYLGRKALGLEPRTAFRLAALCTPIVVTGAAYVAGMTHLPGNFLVLLTVALAASPRPRLVGLTLGLLVFTKLVLAPVALAGCVPLLLRHRRSWTFSGCVAWFSASVAGVLGLLAARGELRGWLDAQFSNIAYSQGPVLAPGGWPVVEHLQRSLEPVAVVAALTVLIVSVAGADAARRRKLEDLRGAVPVAVICMTVSALAVLAVTGLWTHHAQILTAPALLCPPLVASWLQAGGPDRARVFAGVAVAIAVSGIASPHVYLEADTHILSAPMEFVGPSREARAMAEFLGDDPTYARVGINNDAAHARGLTGWNLGCPRFYQYPFDGRDSLDQTAECVSSMPVVIVGRGVFANPGDSDWVAFLGKIRAVLDRDFDCQHQEFGLLCVRRGGTAPAS